MTYGRTQIGKIDFATLPGEEKYDAMSAAWKEINVHDQADQVAVKAMIPPEGWFLKSKYGAKAAKAAFLVAQHSDQEFMRATLVKLEPSVALGEVDGADFALLYDRVATLFDKKPQRYGSQVTCKAGKWQPYEIDPLFSAELGVEVQPHHIAGVRYHTCQPYQSTSLPTGPRSRQARASFPV